MPARRLRAHDYPRLLGRWRAVARRARLRLVVFARASGHEVCGLFGEGRPGPGLYLSAGIHGDEPAATEALIEWAEQETGFLREAPVAIFPCLNPWGLVHNMRTDAAGFDLNRRYDQPGPRVVAAHRRILHGRRFAMALAMHEDYDARGAYVYEVRGPRPFLGERFLDVAAPHVGRETRTRVEQSRCRKGLIRRTIRPEMMRGHPEAFFLRFHCAERVFTLETPSEFDIGARVEAQLAVLRAAQEVLGEWAAA